LELQQTARQISTRPLGLIVALVVALAIGLVGIYFVASNTVMSAGGATTQPANTVPGRVLRQDNWNQEQAPSKVLRQDNWNQE
jgi:hypothetical protein